MQGVEALVVIDGIDINYGIHGWASSSSSLAECFRSADGARDIIDEVEKGAMKTTLMVRNRRAGRRGVMEAGTARNNKRVIPRR